jgi:hypothetical protein
MTLVSDIVVPPEYQELWEKACIIRFGYYGDKVDKKFITWRKRNFPSLIARGSFQDIANLWNGLTATQQSDWDDAGYWSAQSGWDLFAQDTLYRINNEILGLATPNLYHQFKLAEIKLESPATELLITQEYNSMFESDINWAFNILCDMSSTGAGSYAKFVVKVATGYWDDDTDTPEVIEYEYDLTEFTDWDYVSDTYVDGFYGKGSVTFEIHVYKMQGSLYIDGIELDCDDQNYATDWQCDAIEYNWNNKILTTGATFKSIYPPDSI